jgi:hypothetical protein
MRYAWMVIAMLPPACFAQDEAPLLLLRGEVVQIEGLEFSIRTADYRVHRYRTDEQTWIERENNRIRFQALQRGDIVDVVSAREPAPPHAKLVKLVLTRPRAAPVLPWRPLGSTSSLLTRGNLTFTGIVTEVSEERLVLRLRNGEQKTFQLRYDTTFRGEGRLAERGALPAQTRVFVRAGKNLWDEVEAYEVVWGEILRPQDPR